jgi:hypothetical protein
MDKLEYLRKTFARTYKKTFENYVINQIWAKVECLGLCPVTQQSVKRPSNLARIDLYFPKKGAPKNGNHRKQTNPRRPSRYRGGGFCCKGRGEIFYIIHYARRIPE